MTRKIVGALVLALVVTACGRDATSPGAQLSASDARALAANLASLSGNAVGSASAGHTGITSKGGAAIESSQVSWSFSGTLPCPAGGTVSPDLKATGQLDLTDGNATVDFSGTSTFKGCASSVQDGTIAITGTLTSTAFFGVSVQKPSGLETISEKGSFDWVKSDGTKGSCSVDVSGIGDPLTQKFTLSGTVCGHAVS
jgi:hypothetical protein